MGSSVASGISDSTMLMTSFIRKEFLDASARIGGGVSASQSQEDDDHIVVRTEEGGREPFDGSARVEGGVSAGLQSF